jgi:hypothetical protein
MEFGVHERFGLSSERESMRSRTDGSRLSIFTVNQPFKMTPPRSTAPATREGKPPLTALIHLIIPASQ